MLDAGEDQSEVLNPERSLNPEVIRTYRSEPEPIFAQGIFRKLKRSFHNEDLEEELNHGMRHHERAQERVQGGIEEAFKELVYV